MGMFNNTDVLANYQNLKIFLNLSNLNTEVRISCSDTTTSNAYLEDFYIIVQLLKLTGEQPPWSRFRKELRLQHVND